MTKIHIDIETYCELDLKKVGMYRYADHSSTEILCLAYAIDDKPVEIWKEHTDVLLPESFIELLSQKDTILYAHNAAFERTLLNSMAGQRIGFPKTSVTKWRCTAAIAAYHSLPRDLKRCAQTLGVTQKDMQGAASMLKLCKPRRPSMRNHETRWTYDRAQKDFENLYEYCKTDVEVERDIHSVLGELPISETKLYWIDQHVNDQGISVDYDLVEAVRDLAEQHKQNLEQLFISMTDLRITQRNKVFEWLRRHHWPYDDIRSETIDNALKNDMSEWWMTDLMRKVLKLRRVATKTSIAKYNAINRSCNQDAKVRGMFLYHGASTGRWAGRIVQMQNLPRPIKDIEPAIEIVKSRDLESVRLYYEAPNAVFSSLIRSAFVASPGKDLIVSDFGQIEARVLGWLADQKSYMEAFNSNQDIYKAQSAEIFGVEYEDVTADQRQLGKVCVLALGYQMGLDKLQATVKAWGMNIKTDLLEEAFNGYRTANNAIIKLWGSLNRAAIKCVDEDTFVSSHGLKFFRKGRFLCIELPSKRCLHYCDPAIKEIDTPWGDKRNALHYKTLDSMSNSWVEKTTYGGKLVENVVQAIARDLLGSALENVYRSKKYTIIGHVHDEIIAEVDKGEGDITEFDALMVERPDWAEDIPIIAEGYIAERYRK